MPLAYSFVEAGSFARTIKNNSKTKEIMNKSALRSHLLASLVGITFLGLTSARADQQVTAMFELSTRVNATINSADCNNSGGPEVTLEGDITLEGLKMKLILMNNAKGTHTYTTVKESELTLIPLGTSITIPKQPVRGGVGGNPYIYLQFVDGNGAALSDEFYLGRCVQGLTLSPDLINQALASVNVHADGCSNKGGPFITLDGLLTLSGMKAKFIFRNNVKGTHTAQETREITLLDEGTKLVIPKQPSRGGVGGNPIISIQFLHGDGTPIADPVTLGRCVQL